MVTQGNIWYRLIVLQLAEAKKFFGDVKKEGEEGGEVLFL